MSINLPPAPRGVGPGQAPHFSCARCGQPRPMKGRTRARIFGLQTFVCAQCKPAKAAALLLAIAAAALPGCGGGDPPPPDEPTPRVDCQKQPEACK